MASERLLIFRNSTVKKFGSIEFSPVNASGDATWCRVR
jgi:hypothetical protein